MRGLATSLVLALTLPLTACDRLPTTSSQNAYEKALTQWLQHAEAFDYEAMAEMAVKWNEQTQSLERATARDCYRISDIRGFWKIDIARSSVDETLERADLFVWYYPTAATRSGRHVAIETIDGTPKVYLQRAEDEYIFLFGKWEVEVDPGELTAGELREMRYEDHFGPANRNEMQQFVRRMNAGVQYLLQQQVGVDYGTLSKMSPDEQARTLRRLGASLARGRRMVFVSIFQSADFGFMSADTAQRLWEYRSIDPMVKEAQEAPAALGFDPGPADGQMGKRTRSAVRDFQEQQGVEVDGEVDAELLSQLAQAAGP